MKEVEKYAFSVTGINKYLKTLIETDDVLKAVWIKGEISNFKAHSSGHFYFSLKDAGGNISAVMFKSSAAKIKFVPKNGMQVLVSGAIRVYEPAGTYQIYVATMQQTGTGDLHAEFERLKQKLFDEGLFDASRKKPIPKFPEKIGIVTSPTGAAIRDMLNILGRRFKYAEIYIFPTLVQGDGAAQNIARGIQYFDEMTDVDVIITGRGGGSIEDLWAFNDETLARVIAACEKPVISAVGHEIDFCLCDFVADLRAATPSEAAERVVPDAEEWKGRFANAVVMLKDGLKKTVATKRAEMERYSIFAARDAVLRSVDDLRQTTDLMANQLEDAYKLLCERKRGELAKNTALLEAYSPLKVLSRGYSITFGKNGAVLKNSKDVKIGDNVTVKLENGEIGAKVETIN